MGIDAVVPSLEGLICTWFIVTWGSHAQVLVLRLTLGLHYVLKNLTLGSNRVTILVGELLSEILRHVHSYICSWSCSWPDQWAISGSDIWRTALLWEICILLMMINLLGHRVVKIRQIARCGALACSNFVRDLSLEELSAIPVLRLTLHSCPAILISLKLSYIWSLWNLVRVAGSRRHFNRIQILLLVNDLLLLSVWQFIWICILSI